MNKKELAELAKGENIGKAVPVGDFVGIEGADKSIDRAILLDAIGRHMDRLGQPVGPGGSTVFQAIIQSVPNIVVTLAKAGFLTPDEIRRSKACNKYFAGELEKIQKREEAEAAARKEALEAIEQAKAEAEAVAAKAREAASAAGLDAGCGGDDGDES